MIQDWLKDIKEGRPLWLAECRAEMEEDASAIKTNINVVSELGELKEFTISLPKVNPGEEFELMTGFLDANRINAAELLGQKDDTECSMPDPETILLQMKVKESSAKSNYQMPCDPLICGLDVTGNDIKLVMAEGDRIRRVLSYDWNPAIATEDDMIINPICELIEMAANGEKLDGIGIAFSYKDLCVKLENRLKALCKENASIKILSNGNMTAFTVYNELKQSDAGKKVVENGIIALSLDDDIEFGWVKADSSISNYPGNISKCVFRIDSNDDSGFMNQKKLLELANLPTSNPKPGIDLLMNLAEGGDGNAENIFKNLGAYIGHAIREIKFFMQPETNTFVLFGNLASREYIFDLMSIEMEKSAPDAVVLQADASLANTAIMKALAEIDPIAVIQFARSVGAIYYVRTN